MGLRLLDLMCCEGVGAEGYMRAGWEVTGVDRDPNRGRYYPGRFVAGDALAFVRDNAGDFDAIHVSPNCRPHSATRHAHHATGPEHEDNLAEAREAVQATGLPYVIECVEGAPLETPVVLCGAVFSTVEHYAGHRVILRRHRAFESNVFLPAQECLCPDVRGAGLRVVGVYGGGSPTLEAARKRGGGWTPPDQALMARMLGTTRRHTWQGLRQAIPVGMTDYVGTWLASALQAEAVSA